jgi:hypothetical protein
MGQGVHDTDAHRVFTYSGIGCLGGWQNTVVVVEVEKKK